MPRSLSWEQVTRKDVSRALEEYDHLGPQQFFAITCDD